MPDPLYWKLSSIISPFLSAGLAAWIGFRLSRRGAKSDVFLRERVEALQPILTTLGVVRRYCLARTGELDMNENGLALPEGTISILKLKDRLVQDEENAALFLSDAEKNALEPVYVAMSLGSSAERAALMDPSILGSLYGVYESLSEACYEARREMIKEIRQSYNM